MFRVVHPSRRANAMADSRFNLITKAWMMLISSGYGSSYTGSFSRASIFELTPATFEEKLSQNYLHQSLRGQGCYQGRTSAFDQSRTSMILRTLNRVPTSRSKSLVPPLLSSPLFFSFFSFFSLLASLFTIGRSHSLCIPGPAQPCGHHLMPSFEAL